MGAWRGIVLLGGTSLLVACPGRSADDSLAGTYVVSGALTVHRDPGNAVTTPIADEAVTVKVTSRYHQSASYQVMVRGCTLLGSGTPSTAGIQGQCSLQGLEPGMNPSLSGHFLRKNAELELLVTDSTPGDGGPYAWFEYLVHG